MPKLKPNQFYLPCGALITELPIPFQTEMVQANLKDRKNQTRRDRNLDHINNKPENWTVAWVGDTLNDKHTPNITGLMCFGVMFQHKEYPKRLEFVKSPFGNPGDLLWVKETTKVGAWNNEHFKVAFDYKASPELKKTPWVEFQYTDEFEDFQIKLLEKLDRLGVDPVIDEENEVYQYRWEPGQSPFKWTPSMHMPKKAARLWLMIEDIRVERVQEISEEDAKAEGVQYIESDNFFEKGFKNYLTRDLDDPNYDRAVSSFETLWISINGQDSFDSNLWVWVIKYRILSKTGKPSMDVIEKNYLEVTEKEVGNG